MTGDIHAFFLRQKRQFYEEGYLKIAGAVPKVLVDESSTFGQPLHRHCRSGRRRYGEQRSAFHCAELMEAPVILDHIINLDHRNRRRVDGQGQRLACGQGKAISPFSSGSGRRCAGTARSFGRDRQRHEWHAQRLLRAEGSLPLPSCISRICWNPYAGNFTVWPSLIARTRLIFRKSAMKRWLKACPASICRQSR